MKANKFFLKRFRITRKGKLLHRPPGQNHFLAKKSGNKTRARRGKSNFTVLAKTLRKIISY